MAKKKKRRRLKKKYRRLLMRLSLILIAIIVFNIIYKTPVKILEQYVENGNLVLVLNKKGKAALGDKKGEYIASDENNTITLPIDDYQTSLYVKNRNGYISIRKENIDLTYIRSLTIDTDTVYVALNGNHMLLYDFDYEGDIDLSRLIFESEDENIARIDNNGMIYGVNKGKTRINISYEEYADSAEVVVSDMLAIVGDEDDENKPELTDGIYSAADNDLLDEILISRVEEAGYKTRAAAVAAARFLALDFPYRLNYFLENGRIESHFDLYADGEGRYYHKGLYLSSSRYANIDPDLISAGPAYWGESLEELSLERYSVNGLDCSGFISWALLQAGYDPGDLGAGIAREWEDLTDLGENIWLGDAIRNNSLKVGDLLSGGDGPYEGGHIAMLVGIKDGYYYVAEASDDLDLWGLYVTKRDVDSLLATFFLQVDMDNYYGEDGNLTDFWKRS